MKKQYSKPSMEVIKLQPAPAILAGSGYDGEINAPVLFILEDNEE